MTYQSIGNLLEPHLRRDRKRQPLAGLESLYEVTRTGLVWSIAEAQWIDPATKWPFIKLPVGDLELDLNLVEIIALSWLTEPQRAQMRGAGPWVKPWPPALLELEQVIGVPVYALACAADTLTDRDFKHWKRLEGPSRCAEGSVRSAKVEQYKMTVNENYRPPSAPSTANAFHTHRLTIAGLVYEFTTRGARKKAHVNDNVSFKYWESREGVRHILPSTLVARNKFGIPLTRGAS